MTIIGNSVDFLKKSKEGLDYKYLATTHEAVSIKGSGYILYLKPVDDKSITIDDVTYKFAVSNLSSWTCKQIVELNSTVELFGDKFHLVNNTPNSHSIMFLPGKMYLEMSQKPQVVDKLKNCFGLEPIRFEKGFSTPVPTSGILGYVNVVYTLDPA